MDEILGIDNMWIPSALCMVLRILDCILRWPSSCTFRDQALNNVVDKLYTFFNCIMIHAAQVERHISVLSHIYLEFTELNKINGVVASG